MKTTDTMRRVRSYQRATRRRKGNQLFQSRMLVHLVQSSKANSHKKMREQYR
ncbi:hypothetical protein SEA_DRYAD_54 [Streptomyces phage Dryad]|nr:hypothetical protein SEA_DRYAD_54 [Streptomyces phage Dryad]